MAQMKRMVVVGFGVVVALSTARCFDPHYPERLPCDRVDDCPPGQACYAGTCGRALESACDQPEVCNAVDDDCDGEIDETGPDDAGVCTCVVGTIQPCGRCGDGLQSCTAAGLWGACAGATPAGACCPGQTRSCGISTGECRTGLESCTGNGAWSGVCAGGVDPVAERCNGRDDDCDGAIDDGDPEGGAACATGNAACPAGVTRCVAGALTCDAATGDVEVCDGVDNDCDGVVDDGCPEICGDGLDNDGDGVVDDGCVCEAGTLAACYAGPPGTDGVGACHAGMQLCNGTGTGYGACVGEVSPAAEVCGDGVDNDCDGVVDDGCPEVCGDGLDNDGDGVVDDGCVEVCDDGLDNDGDGDVDENCIDICGDGLDNDGDGVIDDGCTLICVGADSDGDGIADNGCLAGRVWNDIDRDNAETVGEPGVADVVMRLHRMVGNADVVVAVTVTDADGRYEFGGMLPGTYQVEIVPPLEWTVVPADFAPDDVDCDFDEVLHTTVWFVMGVASLGDIDAGIIMDTHT